MRTIVIALLGTFALTACAHEPGSAEGPADYTAIAVEPSSKARLYADCIAQAAIAGAYGRAHDDDTEMVLFTCTGAPARSFYDGLANHTAEVGAETQIGGRVYRSTNPVQRDLFGVDYCVSDGDSYQCVVSLNSGKFLQP